METSVKSEIEPVVCHKNATDFELDTRAVDPPSVEIPSVGQATAEHGRADRVPDGRFASGNQVGTATRFQRGNEVARTHGTRAFEQRGEAAAPMDVRNDIDALIAQIKSDLGGAE